LDLALARIRNNVGQLRGPIERSVQGTLGRGVASGVKAAHLPYYLAAVLSLALVGIGVNALLLQPERHPAPLFGFTQPQRPGPAPARVASPPPKPVAGRDAPAPIAPVSPAVPPSRPLAAAQGPAPAPDPIAALLAGETHDDGSHLVLAAQNALAKLGYAIKPDGKEGSATEQALREFERAHGLPLTTEITERLVKQLTQAARSAGR
jgi:Putative peptidoglycan binding domain